MKISGLIITFNEEGIIEKCIKTLFLVCDEVVVIDSYSTDRTVEIAKTNGATVYSHTFSGDGQQRKYGLAFCEHDWILNVDADEIPADDAIQFIQNTDFEDNEFDGYAFRRLNFLGKERIDFAGWYPDYVCRLFNKQTAHPSDLLIHQKIEGRKIKKVNVHLQHYAWKDFHQLIAKKNKYTDLQVEDLMKANRHTSFITPFSHGFFSFFKCYFLKGGILHGSDGFTFSLIQSFFSYMKYAKFRKAKKLVSYGSKQRQPLPEMARENT